jgi:hypothetical protein
MIQKIILAVNRRYSWKIFFILWIAAVISIIAVIPYAMTIQQPTLEKMTLPMPLYQLIIIQILANSIVFGLLIGGGLYFATRIGLGLPFLESRIQKTAPPGNFKSIVFLAAGIGILAALVIILLDLLIFDPFLTSEGIEIPESIQPEPWKGFLASFYGGITEELLLRLFMLTLFAWLGRFMSRTTEGRPTLCILWTANILAALVFGLGHLPATAAMGLPLNALVITRGLVLNGAAGLAFGWLYWSYGLESAMIAHFSADVILHVILAFF